MGKDKELKEHSQKEIEDLLKRFTQSFFDNSLSAFIESFYDNFKNKYKKSPEALQQIEDLKKLLEPMHTAAAAPLPLHDVLQQIDCIEAAAIDNLQKFKLIEDITIALITIEKTISLIEIKTKLIRYLPQNPTTAADNAAAPRFLSEDQAIIINEIIENKGTAVKGSPNYKIVKEVIKAYNTSNQNIHVSTSTKQLKTKAIKSNNFILPIDKLNQNIFFYNQIENLSNDNVGIKLNINMAKKGSKQAAIVEFDYIINQEELEKLYPGLKITAKLNCYDMLVYCATASLYNNNNSVISATQIFEQMGNTGKPNKKHVEKINESLTKMGMARIIINNEHEIKIHKKINKFIYDSSLLPFQRITALINGGKAESAIKIDREPPLIQFARERNQITTIKRDLLSAPISKNNMNVTLLSYLISRICKIKNSKAKSNNKILYSTIFKKCEIDNPTQKTRTKQTIKKILEHFKSKSFIKNYQEATDKSGIIILY